MLKTFLLFALGIVLFAAPADAHRIKIFASGLGDQVEGYGYFAGGGRPGNAAVQLQTKNGDVIQETTADAEGEFRFTVTERRDYVVHIDGGEGHIATFLVSAEELADSLPEPGTQMAAPTVSPALTPAATPAISNEELAILIERAVAKQVQPLRRELDAYEAKIRLHDILGGIGWILGLCGLAALWLSRKRPA